MKQSCRGQATMEFTFGMILALILLVGLINIFQWVGGDLASRRSVHDSQLTQRIKEVQYGPLRQVDPFFHRVTRILPPPDPLPLDTVWGRRTWLLAD